MSLRTATWSRDSTPTTDQRQAGHNKMALANILRNQGRDGRLPQGGQFNQMGRYHTASREFDQRHEVDDSSDDSPAPIPSNSRANYFGYGSSDPSNRYGPVPRNDSANAMPTRWPVYSRKVREDNGPTFGTCRNGRYYCSYVYPNTKSPCICWPDGYTTWYDLARHADAEHGLEEVDMIEALRLSYEDAQWVRSEKHLLDIKRVRDEMFCEACGFRFASNRTDSKERHIRKGACLRRQEKQRMNGFEPSYAPPKRKGDKTNPTNTRR